MKYVKLLLLAYALSNASFESQFAFFCKSVVENGNKAFEGAFNVLGNANAIYSPWNHAWVWTEI
jgi:hypothetical protein